MRKYIYLLIAFTGLAGGKLHAQDSYDAKARKYIEQYRILAMAEQQRSGIPAAITLAQGVHETSAGCSELATLANNHFGIKCKKEWTGQTFAHTDDAPNECFRKYNCADDSYKDHSNYLKNSPRYASLFKLSKTDYAGWAFGLKQCGYATNPKYAQMLIKIIEDYHLQEYTYAAMGNEFGNTYAARQNEIVPEQDAPQAVPAAAAVAVPVAKPAAVAATPKAMPATQPIAVRDAVAPNTKPMYGQVVKINGLKAVYAGKGDTPLEYAYKNNIRYSKLLEINEIPETPLPADMFLYLERKNFKGVRPMHMVKPGETIQQIAQAEGIQIKSLRSMNLLLPGEEPVAGTVLELQRQAAVKPGIAPVSTPVVTNRPKTQEELAASRQATKEATDAAMAAKMQAKVNTVQQLPASKQRNNTAIKVNEDVGLPSVTAPVTAATTPVAAAIPTGSTERPKTQEELAAARKATRDAQAAYDAAMAAKAQARMNAAKRPVASSIKVNEHAMEEPIAAQPVKEPVAGIIPEVAPVVTPQEETVPVAEVQKVPAEEVAAVPAPIENMPQETAKEIIQEPAKPIEQPVAVVPVKTPATETIELPAIEKPVMKPQAVASDINAAKAAPVIDPTVEEAVKPVTIKPVSVPTTAVGTPVKKEVVAAKPVATIPAKTPQVKTEAPAAVKEPVLAAAPLQEAKKEIPVVKEETITPPVTKVIPEAKREMIPAAEPVVTPVAPKPVEEAVVTAAAAPVSAEKMPEVKDPVAEKKENLPVMPPVDATTKAMVKETPKTLPGPPAPVTTAPVKEAPQAPASLPVLGNESKTAANEEPKDELDVLKSKFDRVVYARGKSSATIPAVNVKTEAPVTPPPAKAASAPAEEPVAEIKKEEPVTLAASNDPAKFYTVKRGDTAFSIAKNNNITMRQLMDWNGLDFDAIKVGQRLRIKP